MTEASKPAQKISPQDAWLRKQFSWKNVEHLLKDGKILSLVYDFEATDLNPMFAAPTQFCGKIVDVQGRIVDRLKIDIQVPEDVAISPQAAIVTQSDPEALYQPEGRVPPHIAAGQIMLFLRNPYRKLWDTLDNKALFIPKGKDKAEEVRVYTVSSPDGGKHASFRIHQGGKYISLSYPDRVNDVCNAIESAADKPLLATAIAGVLGVMKKTVFNVRTQTFDQKEIARRIRAYEGETDAFLKALELKMGSEYPSEMNAVPKAERLQDGNTTYRDPDGTRWRKFAAPAITTGHNIRRYDDRLLWAFLHRAMSDEIFLTHIKKFGRFRVDTLDLAKLVALLDDSGENGFKPGIKINKETGETYRAFTLSSLMEANTRDANPERGIDEGVRMPDGSKYERRYAHADAEYDVDANIALKAYLRKRAPDVVGMVEGHTDYEQRLKPFLIGGEGFEPRPLRAFARGIFPYGAHLHIGVCAGIDEEIEERRQAVMIRTDTDQLLEDYTYIIGGVSKKLLEMSVEELAAMLKEQERKPDALCETINLRKNPPVVTAQMAFERGKGGNPDRQEENRRFVLAHPDFCARLILAHRKIMRPMPDFRSIPNPQPEEHLFTSIAAPKHHEFTMDGRDTLLTEDIHIEWVKALRLSRKIDAALRRAIKPQTVEFEARPDSLQTFIERMESVEKHLQKYLNRKTDILPPPDRSFTPPKWDTPPAGGKPGVPHAMSQQECEELTANAVEYLWKLRAEFMHKFSDHTTQFTVQDEYGHSIDWADLNRMNPRDRANRLRNGEYAIHMERLNWSAELVACMFRDAGRIDWVKNYWAERGQVKMVREWEDWEEYFADRRAGRFHGAPHEDTDEKRWMTAVNGIKDADRILGNMRRGDIRAREDEWGEWDSFMPEGDKAEPILHASKALCQRQLAENPMTPERQHRLGYDPGNSGFPIEHARYNIPAHARIITIDAPDRMLEKPLSHHHVARKVLMLNPDEEQRRALAEAGPDTYLLLRGSQTGRLFLAAKAALLSPEAIQPSPYFHEVYTAAATRYVDSGMDAPMPESFLPIAVEALAPVPGKVDRDAQTIKIPCWENFMATVSPELGYRNTPLTGLVIKDYGHKPTLGPARLLGMTAEKLKSGLIESGWEVPATVTHVRTMTLKEMQERIEVGTKQIRAAVKLNMESVEALRAALEEGHITSDQAKTAGHTSLPALRKLMNKDGFTPADAQHYGYTGLLDMRSKLTGLFTEQEREPGRDDNLLHFIDIAPVDKAQTPMTWHRPGRRPEVRLAEPTNDNALPDPTHLHGAPGIERAHRSIRQERA